MRVITLLFRESTGIWNRLRYAEAVNTAGHAERGGKHPKSIGLPDFWVRPGISRRPWMGVQALGEGRELSFIPLCSKQRLFSSLVGGWNNPQPKSQ